MSEMCSWTGKWFRLGIIAVWIGPSVTGTSLKEGVSGVGEGGGTDAKGGAGTLPRGAAESGVGEAETVGSTVASGTDGVAMEGAGVAVGGIAVVGVGVGARVGKGVATGAGVVGAGPGSQATTSKASATARIAVNGRASIIRDAQI